MRFRHFILIVCIALLSGCEIGGPCGCRMRFPGYKDDCGPKDTPECEGNACTDITITQKDVGFQIKNNGAKKVKVEVRWGGLIQPCMDWWSIVLGPGDTHDHGNGDMCFPWKANYVSASTPVEPVPTTPKIVEFTITPANLAAGGSVEFKVVLDRPAPPGTEVGFSSITYTGVTSTVIDAPLKWTFNAGVTEFKNTVHTQKVVSETTHIRFTAYNSVSQVNADLRAN